MNGIWSAVFIGVLCGSVLFGCSSSQYHSTKIPNNLIYLGGKSRTDDQTKDAFSHPNPQLNRTQRTHFFSGESLFDQAWVTAPSSTSGRDGLGPYFNARSCAECHVKDGRGAPPKKGEPFVSILLRLSIPGRTEIGAPKPDPRYGGQLQSFALQGIPVEGHVRIVTETIEGRFMDGQIYTLEKPEYVIENSNYGDFHTQLMISPRVAQSVIGMGLLENVPESELLAIAKSQVKAGKGISGKPNWVWDSEKGEKTIGRFGWKSNQPTVRQQVAGAFLGDIGITSVLNPSQNMTVAQQDVNQNTIHGGVPEISSRLLDRVVLYTQNLAVPKRRNVDDPIVVEGARHFENMNCVSCHRPTLSSNDDMIHPFTDLLLHDMGPELADHRPDFEANGREWRTAPLWGIGLVKTVNGHTRFLHDGRARNLEEAILWHGGEADASKQQYVALSKKERDAVIAFLKSL